MIVSKVETN